MLRENVNVFDGDDLFSFVSRKVIFPENLEEKISSVRKAGKRIATLNGSFDLLHAGHLYIFEEAAKQANVLLVAINSDASVKKYKSTERPIIPLKERLTLVAALEMVDYVTWFDEPDPCAILDRIRPDVHVNGAEYGEHCIEANTVRSHGGRLHLVKRQGALATSAIIKKIKELCD